jgi:DNA polymerase III subunit epsilon
MCDLDHMAATLEAAGYRVLRRLVPRAVINEPDGCDRHLGIVLDVETTGLDPARDEIIELAMVPFTFGADGRIFDIREPFHALRQPSIPIPAEITDITGIDDAAVAGHVIDPGEMARFVEPAVLIIAHNAEFDRPFAERFHRCFETRCWGCSMTEIDWRAEGLRSIRLASLLTDLGFFYDRHRALSDCYALIELLARPLPRSGALALARLVERARQPTWRIWATGAPFETKDVLKARGYRWNPGDDGRPKSWYFDACTEQREAEIAFLRREIYGRESVCPPIEKLTAFERFAPRRAGAV